MLNLHHILCDISEGYVLIKSNQDSCVTCVIIQFSATP